MAIMYKFFNGKTTSEAFDLPSISRGDLPLEYRANDVIPLMQVSVETTDNVPVFVGDLVRIQFPKTVVRGREREGNTILAVLEWDGDVCSVVANEVYERGLNWAHHYLHPDLTITRVGSHLEDPSAAVKLYKSM